MALCFQFWQNAYSQFYNVPNDYSFSLLTEKNLANSDSSIHTGIKPYIPFFSNKYQHVEDNSGVFKYITDDPLVNTIFYNHLIKVEPKKENFKLRIDPLLNGEKGADFAENYKTKLYTNTRGIIASGTIGNKFYFETMFAENQSVFPIYIDKQAKASLIVPGQGRWKTFKVTGYDYAFSSGFISVQPIKNLNIQVGHGKQKIGNGYRSLLLSDNSFNYPYARFTQQWFKGKVQYNNIYAVLMNLSPASIKINPYAERLFQKKAASFQYLSIKAGKSLTIGFFQGMIWQAGDDRNKQHLNWNYFNPIIYSNLASYGLNNKNNIVAGGDFKLKLTNKINLYGQLMLDNLSKSNSTKNMGYQTGINYFDALGVKNLFLQMEYNRVSDAGYLSPKVALTDQSYSHYNQYLAYTPGNGQEFIVIGDYKIKRFFTSIKYNYQSVSYQAGGYYYNNILQFKFGYLINPAYNLNISAGMIYRKQNFSNFNTLNNQTNYIYLAVKTSLYNLYYDF